MYFLSPPRATYPSLLLLCYSGTFVRPAKARFDITLAPQSLHFVFLESRWLVEDRSWPRFTLVGQSLGSMYLAWEALSKFIPDLYIGVCCLPSFIAGTIPLTLRDTPAFSFRRYDGVCFYLSRRRVACWHSHRRICALSYHQYRYASARGGPSDDVCQFESDHIFYVLKPPQVTVSLIIVQRLQTFEVTCSPPSRYYRLFMYHYSLALRRSSFLMVNSSWTKNHVDSILVHSDSFLDLIHLPFTSIGGLFLLFTRALAPPSLTHVHTAPKRAEIVYPPCDTHALSQLPLERHPSLLLSLAQFRYGVFFPALFRLCAHERQGQRRTTRHRFA